MAKASGKHSPPSSDRLRQKPLQAANARGRAIAQKRRDAQDGRLQRALMAEDGYLDEIEDLISADYRHILENPYLTTEVMMMKRCYNALQKSPHDPEACDLLKRCRQHPHHRKKPLMCCPIFRHDRIMDTGSVLMERYVSPHVQDELYLLTVIFSFCENLEQLVDSIDQARRDLTNAIHSLSKQKHGVVIVGAFEPDLRSPDELNGQTRLLNMVHDLHGYIPATGGWALTGHFFVRIPHRAEFEAVLDQAFPAQRNWDRVRFDPIYKDKPEEDALMNIMRYGQKTMLELFKVPSRGEERKAYDAHLCHIQSAFAGAQFEADDAFDTNAAIVQWLKFMHQVGPEKMYFAMESSHAQKWLSASEMNRLLAKGDNRMANGKMRFEIHRDVGSKLKGTPHSILRGRKRHLRTRALRHDQEWCDMTYAGEHDDLNMSHNNLSWIFAPAKLREHIASLHKYGRQTTLKVWAGHCCQSPTSPDSANGCFARLLDVKTSSTGSGNSKKPPHDKDNAEKSVSSTPEAPTWMTSLVKTPGKRFGKDPGHLKNITRSASRRNSCTRKPRAG